MFKTTIGLSSIPNAFDMRVVNSTMSVALLPTKEVPTIFCTLTLPTTIMLSVSFNCSFTTTLLVHAEGRLVGTWFATSIAPFSSRPKSPLTLMC